MGTRRNGEGEIPTFVGMTLQDAAGYPAAEILGFGLPAPSSWPVEGFAGAFTPCVRVIQPQARAIQPRLRGHSSPLPSPYGSGAPAKAVIQQSRGRSRMPQSGMPDQVLSGQEGVLLLVFAEGFLCLRCEEHMF